MKTFKLDIHRHYYYEYEVQAPSQEDAEKQALNDLKGETKNVNLLETGCYDTDTFEIKEV